MEWLTHVPHQLVEHSSFGPLHVTPRHEFTDGGGDGANAGGGAEEGLRGGDGAGGGGAVLGAVSVSISSVI